jgi:hypothetical protein
VINTTAQLVLSCLNDIKVLATITPERTSATPDARTLKEIVPANLRCDRCGTGSSCPRAPRKR